MSQPTGFKDSLHPDYVCQLKKFLYGLKQSPRKWFETFSTYLIAYGFHQSAADPSLLIYNKDAKTIYILVYVDDILLTGNDAATITHLLSALHNRFNMKNLGSISYFLGMQVLHTDNGFHLSQSKYAADILQKAGMAECKPISTPIASKTPFSGSTTLPSVQADLFKQLVGSLQYLTLTRPDIFYTVNRLCQHMHQPQEIHFQLLKHLLRYLKGTLSFGLPLVATTLRLSAYSDSDRAGNPVDRKSTTGYCAFLGSNLISWQVKKQKTVARSSTEAEYRALATAAMDIIWLQRLLGEFGISSSSPTTLFCDNISYIALANNPVFHARTKHIEIDFHFVRECFHNKLLHVTHVHTTDQLADLFTKALSLQRFQFLRHKLTIHEPNISLRGGDKLCDKQAHISLHASTTLPR
ncbi:Retrovirus-related Pol polyprotein from transposon TNT 1-94 [Dendrobium catenatum]|uniref:Retrovirus-related Pol polyprotein from transposon TNT 1-94 n=1 Tax=Dendrobium catenatum TaxID=906689 RepID=A0A2I0VJX1_9ASPA|nr:Retrovirus-related Pol polyprotein from transposon TNT 1-94 [Dendrobium catenatum]